MEAHMRQILFKGILLLLLVAFVGTMSSALAQGTLASVSGTVTDKAGRALPGANVVIKHAESGMLSGATTGSDGKYVVKNLRPGSGYSIGVSLLGFKKQSVENVTFEAGQSLNRNFSLVEEVYQQGEVIVEVNRAKERETPVAFSTVDSKFINKLLHTQDAPSLVKMIPGVFSYSPDGVANGESKMYVRGFDQNRVQVMINGIPTNDPESNAVYWSNWGAVSSAAASIQVQRGAGSSLYGAGSFGGSFNVITQRIPYTAGADVNLNFGTPELAVYGGTLSSGLLMDNLVAGSLSYAWKEGRGSREGAFYQGANYYAGVSLYPAGSTAVTFLLHGGPQEHGYSYSGPIAYFKKYGYTANPAYYLPVGILSKSLGAKTVEDSLNLKGDSRFLVDSKYKTLSHNFYHKPQFEIHAVHDLDENNRIQGTFFYSVGRGGGSSVTKFGALTNATYGAPTNVIPWLQDNGVIKEDSAKALANYFLKSAYQRISYSLHRQYGVVASWDWKFSDELKFTFGGEYRDWYADHPGHFTNLYGKTYVQDVSYGYRVNGAIRSGKTFYRRTYQGDMDFGGTDKVDVNYINPFMGYTLSSDNGTYNSQYRNYVGQTTQGTIFAQASYKLIEDLTLTGSIQYVNYKYHLTENMPSESAVADSVGAPATGVEGLNADGYFYMKGSGSATATPASWFKFKLVDEIRTRGFWQPKFGANYNVTEAINVFGSYAHTERIVDLGVWYNYGNVNPNADDEISNQLEFGAGYKTNEVSARINFYTMSWENKTATITDISKAGAPGYDRNGNRWELVGSSTNQGIEFEASYNLASLTSLEGLSVGASFTAMDNKWTKVLDQVKTDPNDGTRRKFNASAVNDTGGTYAIYFDELEGKVNASGPFTTLGLALNYETESWFAGITGIYQANFYAFDGGSYIATDGSFDAAGKFTAKYDNKLPSSMTLDLAAGYNLALDFAHVRLSLQVFNLLDKKYLISADRSGVIPGSLRVVRFNLSAGI
jgi:outer membrane receptor protein involved in Fe transport